uniref:Putative calcineurin-like phosphoesterase n=1 Tax=viral metagenome TaxID=1070528 RepID=A0A6H1ZDP0_9ZZZZ
MGIRRIFCLSDIHAPYEDKNALRKVEQVLIRGKWDAFVNLGDLIDFDIISRFSEGKPGLINSTISKQANAAADILARHSSYATRENSACKLYFMGGNHERRLDDLLDRMPVLEGLVDIKKLLRLDSYGYTYFKHGEILKIGTANFFHGLYTGTTHARRTAAAINGTAIYGHTHSMESNSAPGFSGASGKAFSTGCLCKMDMPYLKGAPTNWEQGYAIVEIDSSKVDVLQHRL